METIRRKYRSARALVRTEGAAGLVAAIAYQPGVRRLIEAQRLFQPSFWRQWNNPVLGRWVELRGNRVRIDGCTFTLDSPAIPTGLKALFLFDRYERAERVALRRYLDPEVPVVEFGGSLGVVACVTNRRLRDPSRHVVVEANANMLAVLEANRARNRCGFTVLHRAVAYDAPTVAFYEDDSFLAGSVLEGRAGHEGRPRRVVHVPTISLRDILDSYAFARCTLVCDIEGAEADLVAHELDVLRDRVGTMVLETHPGAIGAAAVHEMLERLAGAGFRLLAEDAGTVVLRHETVPAA